MIIKSVRVGSAASQRRFRDHLFRGAENDAVEIVRGTEADIIDLFADARRGGARYAVRHWIIAPHEATTRAQASLVVDMLAKEFGFTASAAVMIEHQKQRATGDAFGVHWHVAVGEFNPATGRVLSSSFDHPRHELVARRAEIAFGHQIVPGAHSRAVIERLRSDGHDADAAHLRKALDAAQPEKPREGFSIEGHRGREAEGIDLPASRIAIRDAWHSTKTRAELMAALGGLGLATSPGEKTGEWIVRSGDQFLGSLRRLARVTKADFLDRMEKPDVRPADPTIDDRQDHRPTTRRYPETPASAGGSSAHPHHSGSAGIASLSAGGHGSVGQHDEGGCEAGEVTGGSPREFDGAWRREGASASGAGALTQALDGFRQRLARTLSDLEPLTRESSDSVNQTLAEDEVAARRAIIEANRSQPVSTSALEAARHAADAAMADHALLMQRLREIDRQIIEGRHQPPRSWMDRFQGEQRPNADLEGLQREHDMLAARQRVGEQRMLNSRATVAREEHQHFADLASEAQRQRQAVADAKAQLADVQQARRLVILLPRLAHCRPPYVRALGARIRRSRQRFGNPDATNIWGLPADGPGTGNRR